MIKKYYFISFIFCSFLVTKLLSQPNTYTPTIIPPSPDASSLGKYGEIPVGKYAGTAEVNIPIYEIKVGEFTIPISLSYSTSGIKVEELSSWIGLGWSLNAGGLIAVSAVGLPDFTENSGYLKNSYDLETFPDLSESEKKQLVYYINSATLDVDPDVYTYNINGNSGRFYIKKNMTISCIPKNNWKITIPSQNPIQWEVVDGDGNKYIFNLREISSANDQRAHTNTYNSAYYLTKIITNKGKEVIFEYQPYYSTYYTKSEGRKDYPDFGAQGGQTSCLNTNYVEHYYNLEIAGERIKSISWDGGLIQFNKSAVNRQDIQNDYSLGNIQIFDASHNLVRQFDLQHDYFTTQCCDNTPSYITDIMPNKRLRLLSVKESLNNNVKPPYLFTYDLQTLPYYFSKAQDLWGYYNGASNLTLLPELDEIHGDANRKVTDYAMAGILKKITYPTGGSTSFMYENNEAGIPKNIYDENVFPCFALSKEPGMISTDVKLPNKPTSTLSVYGIGNKLFNFSIVYPDPITCSTNDRLCVGDLHVSLTSNDGQYINLLPISDFVNGIAQGTVWLVGGKTYTLSISGSTDQNQTTCTLYGNQDPQVFNVNGTTYLNVKVGGLRIQSITNSPNVGEATITKYYYTSDVAANDDNKTNFFSSGGLSSYPIFGYSSSYFANGAHADYNCRKYTMTANSTAPMTLNGGSTVGYKFVQEVKFSMNDILKTITQFTSIDEYPDYYDYGEYPYVNSQLHDYQRGRILNEKNYKYSNNAFEIVSEEKTSYSDVSWIYTPGSVTGCTDFYFDDRSTDPICNNTIFKNYLVNTRWLQKTSSEFITYVNGVPGITTKNNFFYNNSNNLQVTKIETLNSKGNLMQSSFKYPDDFANSGTPNIYDDMLTKHMISQIIQSTKSNISNSLEVEKIQTDYDKFNGALILPSTIQHSVGGNPLNIEITNNLYDTKGNILQSTLRGGLFKSYIWDYNFNHPIAEINNSKFNNVAYTSFEADGQGNWTYSGTPVLDATAPTGQYAYSLSNGVINTGTSVVLDATKSYIVSYWSKSSTSYTVQGTVTNGVTTGKSIGGWTYYEHLITGVTSTNIKLPAGNTGTGKIDEVRLYPAKAQMTTYTYAPLIGMTSQCDVNNKISYSEYDALGRLDLIRDQDKNILKKYCYNYAGQVTDCNVAMYYNKADTVMLAKSCSTGQTGTVSPYVISAGTFTSTFSQAAADQKAQTDSAANAQTFANNNGACITAKTVAVTCARSGSSTPFTIQLTNLQTNQQYSVNLDAATSSGTVYVPAGSYNVICSGSGITTPFSYAINYNGGSIYTSGTSALIYNIVISDYASINISNLL